MLQMHFGRECNETPDLRRSERIPLLRSLSQILALIFFPRLHVNQPRTKDNAPVFIPFFVFVIFSVIVHQGFGHTGMLLLIVMWCLCSMHLYDRTVFVCHRVFVHKVKCITHLQICIIAFTMYVTLVLGGTAVLHKCCCSRLLHVTDLRSGCQAQITAVLSD